MDVLTIEDLRRGARWRLPKALFDYVDGAADDEWTRRRNRSVFQQLAFRPRVLVDVSERDLSTTVLGQRVSMPIMIAPTGMAGMCWPNGEVLAAKAAGQLGTIYALSTYSCASLEEVAQAASGPLWFQLYISKDRELTAELVDRAADLGYRALLLTVDTQVPSLRTRDWRNGFSAPPRITSRNVLDSAWRVGWLMRFLRGPRPRFGNLKGGAATTPSQLTALAGYVSRQIDGSITWNDLDDLRARWKGALLVKGVLSADEARRAVDHGVDGILVSNHGGRQLDYAPASIEVLPEIADAVQGRAEVLLDSGARRGSDVVKALALGAKAVLVGRPHLYGLACAGQAGVAQALGILRDELDRCLALIGCPRVADLDRSYVSWRRPPDA